MGYRVTTKHQRRVYKGGFRVETNSKVPNPGDRKALESLCRKWDSSKVFKQR